jgi:hypothetical protein
MKTDEHSEYLRRQVEEIEHRVYQLVNEAIETDRNLTDQDHILLVEEIVGVQLSRILAAKILAGGVATSEAAIARITTFARGVAAHEVGKRLGAVYEPD